MSRGSPEGRRAGIAAFLASSAVAALGISSFAGQAPDTVPRVVPEGAVQIHAAVAISALLLAQEALVAVKAAAKARRRGGSETEAFAEELRRRGAIG